MWSALARIFCSAHVGTGTETTYFATRLIRINTATSSARESDFCPQALVLCSCVVRLREIL
jgi:hypothetical protein